MSMRHEIYEDGKLVRVENLPDSALVQPDDLAAQVDALTQQLVDLQAQVEAMAQPKAAP